MGGFLESLSWFTAIVYPLISAAAIVSVLRGRKEPAAMLAWILTVLALPVFGVFLYLTFGGDRVRLRARRKIRRIERQVGKRRAAYRGRHGHGHEPAGHGLSDELLAVERMCRNISDMPAVGGNEITIHAVANETFDALERALRAAEDHIHLEYYIWQPDETGRHFRDVLCEQARRGIAVRLLLDSVGSWRIGSRFLAPLHAAGVQVAFFLPLFRFRRSWTPHLRNHRKLAVIDGRVALFGSQNVGNEYRGWRERFSPWHDTHLQVRGPGVRYLQQTFAEDWLVAARQPLEGERYFPKLPPRGDSVMQVLPTGPDQDLSLLEHVVFSAVSTARESVRFATAYFVPNAAVRVALVHAALRGVRVQIVISQQNDAPLAVWAGRSFYDELVAAGVEIYEFAPGVLHSKIVAIDDAWAVVGSANMDVRSFRLNFELTALVYDPAVARALGTTIDGHAAASQRITQRTVEEQGFWTDLGEGVARLFAPLL